MTVAGPRSQPTAHRVLRRWRTWRGPAAALIAIVAVAALGTFLAAPRPGGRMDAAATGPDGAHALAALLRDHGVEVVVATTVADVERAARPGALLLVAQTQHLTSDALLGRLASAPGDVLLVQPTSHARAALAPELRSGGISVVDGMPNCSLREADRAGSVQFGPSATYVAANGTALTSCYGGVLVRYRDGERTITAIGNSDFMTNKGLPRAGNAALAMNLAGAHPRLVWFAPQRAESETPSSRTIFDVIPDNVSWVFWQLWLVVALLALWQGRRIGPLVAEDLPVVVRASETVEGRGRLYRSRRARDRAAQALRTASLRRLLPRLGLGAGTPASVVVAAVAQRTGISSDWLAHHLFGPPPATDTDLLQLARVLDEIERQVTRL
ncbi:DUF4350 domain-containing protein [Mycobacterium sp. SM1]|uniref:DUF4350 domain-containing protein n=1 Tax=Mycobacterium sp. SM1 TaxID=2816243 RepID=UPI001BCD0123|nr:DUF4350 domain-containing protein [Mycobacterium sp. SM1]MBS4727759.1 DUF4350 domain-containing protein [Mycobacterium sp. SM1]